MRQRDDLPCPMLEYERRLRDLRKRMEKRGVDAMMTTTPENICYLTAFDSHGYYRFQTLVVPLEGEPFMVPRLLEERGVIAWTWLEITRPYEDFEDPIQKVKEALEEFDLQDKRIGYEKDCWFFTALQQEQLFRECPKVTFIDCSGIVEEGRLIKSEYEIEIMRKVARITGTSMRAGIDVVREGVTEYDIAAEIYHTMIKAGSDFPPEAVVTSGQGSTIHGYWTGRTIQENDLVFLELGACLEQYHAALMRTVYVGKPDDRLLEAEKVVLEAMDVSIGAIKPGVPAGQVDALNRQIIANSGIGAEQASRSAYSIGIGMPPDWGEGQILSMQPGELRPLEANMTFHLIPWIQIQGKGGIGLSETIRVTENGCELLTDFERKLFVK